MVRENDSFAGQMIEHGPNIGVTAQQSRFHTDASDGILSREIIVKDLSITIGERELLSHAELNLQPGRHYVLIGRNGVGKSTLLKAIGVGLVPGIPRSLKILLLGQGTEKEGVEKQQDGEHLTETVLQHVVRANHTRQRLLDEAACLSEASENTVEPIAMVRAYRELHRQRLERRTAEARIVAQRRSGARGLKARKELRELEGELQMMMAGLGALDLEDHTSMAPQNLVSETQCAYDMLTEVQSTLLMMDASGAETKARSVLLALGFSANIIDRPLAQLSGGLRTRCNLACALCQPSDLLMLDEPTNFLDLPSIIWLESYIKNLSGKTTVVVVTHDRAFADAIADELLVLRNLTLDTFRGNVSAYESNRLKTYKHLSHMADVQEKQKKHMQSSIDANIKAAARAGDDKKLKQAVSRRKKLNERMGLQTSSKGTRFKLNRDLAGYHLNRRDDIEVPTFDAPPRMNIPLSPSELRYPGALLSCDHVSFSYLQAKSPVLKDINLVVHPGERIGIAGLNGSGKSTLVGLIMSSVGSDILRGTFKGTITRHTRAKFGLFSQTTVEELTDLGTKTPSLTALAHLMEITGAEIEEKHARGLLSSLGLPPRAQSDVPIALLSGGQKVRLALAKVLWDPPHLLILDEVTTHLDSDTIQALALALRRYEGAIMVVTHDRFFMRCVVEGESLRFLMTRAREDAQGVKDEEESGDEEGDGKTGMVYRLSKSVLTKLEGGMQQYEALAEKAIAKLAKAS